MGNFISNNSLNSDTTIKEDLLLENESLKIQVGSLKNIIKKDTDKINNLKDQVSFLEKNLKDNDCLICKFL